MKFKTLFTGTLIVLLALGRQARAADQPAPKPKSASIQEIVLVRQADVSADKASAWKREGFKAVALVMEDGIQPSAWARTANTISAKSLELYYWIEVARNPALAEAHPRWMASMGMHEDWQEKFPKVVPPQEGEVAKVFPWVSIGYQEAFDAQLERATELVRRVPPNFRGVFLNDLQGGPSSCGCGNLQCRWAIDYHTESTGTKFEADDMASQFVAALRQRVGGKAIIPVWTTECEEEDLPSKKKTNFTTGYCGSVACAHGLCPKDFTKQWTALAKLGEEPIGLLSLHREFKRARKEYGEGPAWIVRPVSYLDKVLPQFAGAPIPHQRLWLVVQGSTKDEELAARRIAAQTGVGSVIVARARIDQSYEPRVISLK